MITDESCGIGLRVQQGEEIGSGSRVQGSELLAACSFNRAVHKRSYELGLFRARFADQVATQGNCSTGSLGFIYLSPQLLGPRPCRETHY